MKRIVTCIAGGFLTLASFGAQSQTGGVQLNMERGFYLGAGIGRSEARDFCSIGGACDSSDITGNVYAGYRINRYAAIEAGYAHLGKATTSGFIGAAPVVLDIKTTAIELVGLGIVPFTDRFSIFAKAGFFRYDSDGTASGALAATASDKGTELTVGVGTDYVFSQAWAARLEWQRYYEVGSGVLTMPKADITVLRLGARYHF